MNILIRIYKRIMPVQGVGNNIKGVPVITILRTLMGGGNFKVIGNNNTVICKNKSLGNTKFVIKGDNNKVIIEKGVRINAGVIWIENQNNCISIGKDTTIEEAHLAVAENNLSITIGNDCMFSKDIRISTTDSHSIIDNLTGKRINKGESIVIGNHVWVGYRSCINKGVIIGDNSVIASNTLITHDVPSNVIVAGIPAQVKKNNITWNRKRIL